MKAAGTGARRSQCCDDPHVELLEAIDGLDDLVHGGKRRTLHAGEVLVERGALLAAVARLRAAVETDLPDVVAPAVTAPLGRLERICADAPERRGGRVALDREAVYDELDTARAVVGEDIRRQRDG
jgi:hypothetical protein